MDCVISFEEISLLRRSKRKIVTDTLLQKALKCVGVYIFKFILNIDKVSLLLLSYAVARGNILNFLQELLQAYFRIFRICFYGIINKHSKICKSGYYLFFN